MAITSFESEQSGIVHSTKYDYYCKRLATCGSDGKIIIFESTEDSMKKVAEQSRHEHSAWDVAWSHPRFGVYLASVGFDKKVIIWKEHSPNVWKKSHSYFKHTNSVNACEFAPNEYGLILLCGSSDGYISLHELKSNTTLIDDIYHIDEGWISWKITAHSTGVNCVSWAPSFYPISFKAENKNNTSFPPMRFTTGGCDKLVKVWTHNNKSNSTIKSEEDFACVDLESHKDWVRDVTWLKYVGYEYDTIASCGEDETVKIWKLEGSKWKSNDIKKIFGCPTWKAEWSYCGTYLAVSAGDNCVYIFQENNDGIWEETSKLSQSFNSSEHRQQLLND